MIYLMGSVLPQVSPVSKVKIVSVQKGFPNLAYTLPGVSMVLDLRAAME